MADAASPREVHERAAALIAALERYRARRALDGGGEGAECLLERLPELESMAAHQRRRIEMVGRAVDEGWMERELAEETYDIAREEGLEPAFAFELVRCGVAVCEPPDSDLAESTAVKGHPEWLEPPIPTAEAERERRLRLSFRRLHRFLEEKPTPEEALVAFAAEPDVGECEL